MTRRFVFILFLVFSCVGQVVFAETNPDEALSVEKGVFWGAEQLFSYERGQESVGIFDQSGHLAFSVSCPDDHSVILSCGYSKTFQSLFVIKETMSLEPRRYDLVMVTPSFSTVLVSKSPLAFYTPVLIEHNGFHVAYLADDSAIVLVDAANGQVLQRIKTETPARNLRLDGAGDLSAIRFDRFNPTLRRFMPGRIDVGHIGISPSRLIEPRRPDDQSADRFSDQRILPRPTTAMLEKSIKKTIGFGDSITYGYIKKLEHPELGYIPRLLGKLQQNIYADAELFNEGIGGSTTDKGVLRIDEVILRDRAQNLLLHYGTNDILYVDTVPVSEILYNIGYMADRVLEYGMNPVLSTLIPRNSYDCFGIKLQRAIDISEGIRELAKEKGLPMVDFWNLFSTYPKKDGGYFSLMSDNVHPSEKGYELMAEEWLKILLTFPPQMPESATTASSTPTRVLMQWPDNEELDLHHYNLRFGYQPNQLVHTASVQLPAFEFAWFPFYGPSRGTLYFQVQAVDNSGSSSPWSTLQQLVFTVNH